MQKRQGTETAKKLPDGLVEFRLNQHSHSPLASGQMGQVITVKATDLPKIQKMKLGEVVENDPVETEDDEE